MSEETPIVDYDLSKDLEFARNLAAQMREGYGRHNSNLSFREPVNTENVLIFDPSYSENQQARVIGRIGDNALRERWQDCEIGDAVPEAKMEYGYELHSLTGCQFIDKCVPILDRPMPRAMWEREGTEPNRATTTPYEKRTFELVRFEMRSDEDGRWHDQYFWKRIG